MNYFSCEFRIAYYYIANLPDTDESQIIYRSIDGIPSCCYVAKDSLCKFGTTMFYSTASRHCRFFFFFFEPQNITSEHTPVYKNISLTKAYP